MIKNKQRYTAFLYELFGSFLIAVSLYNFAAGSAFPMTGFSGISLIFYRLFSVPLGWSNLALNLPVALICYRLLGRGFFFRSLRCMIISSLMTDYLAPLFPVYGGERMLAALCTGVLSGIGYAVIYMQNSSTGGADFIIMAIKARKPHLPLGNITFAFAVSVILLTWFIFGDANGVIYGLIINYAAGTVINQTMYGVHAGKFTMIITDHGTEVAAAIEDCCHRGSTIVDAMGGYQQAPKQAVFCACNNKQMFQLEKAVKAVDPDSFMVIWDSNEVRGNGFKNISVAP